MEKKETYKGQEIVLTIEPKGQHYMLTTTISGKPFNHGDNRITEEDVIAGTRATKAMEAAKKKIDGSFYPANVLTALTAQGFAPKAEPGKPGK